MRRMTRFTEGGSGMSESSCLAKRVGSVDLAKSSAGDIDTRSSTGSGCGSYEVEATGTSEMGLPYMAIETVSKSPRTIIKRVAN